MFPLILPGASPAQGKHGIELSRAGSDDKALVRFVDPKTRRYHEPWASFQTHWLKDVDAKLSGIDISDELMAINCLTGVFGATHTHTDIPRLLKKLEIERDPLHTINIIRPRKGLHARLVSFACRCDKQPVTVSADQIAATYRQQIVAQTTTEQFHLKVVGFKTEQDAINALRNAGPNNTDFSKIQHAIGAQSRPDDGDLGWHWFGRFSPETRSKITSDTGRLAGPTKRSYCLLCFVQYRVKRINV